ncbi:jg24228, partial [Pararge aegeria aegeria]
TVRTCELVPLNQGELEARVAGARSARGELLRALPAVLRALCHILIAQRQKLRTAQSTLAAHTATKVK